MSIADTVLYGSDAASTVSRSFSSDAIVAENKRRMKMAQRREMLSDNFADMVHAAMAAIFTDEDLRQRIAPHVTIEHNLMGSIVRTISVVYAWGAQRRLGDGRSGNDKRYQELIRECRLDSRLAIANEIGNACNDVLLRPVVRNGKMAVDVLPPDSVTVIPSEDCPTEIGTLFVYRRYPDMVPPKAYVDVWTADTVEYYEGSYSRISLAWDIGPGAARASIEQARGGSWWSWLELRPRRDVKPGWRQDNPYGRIPFVPVHRAEPVDAFWDTTRGQDMVDTTVTINVLGSFLRRLGKDQCEKILAHTGPPEDLPPQQQLDALAVVSLPGGGQVLDWQHDPEKLLAQIRWRAGAVSARYGLPAGLLFLDGHAFNAQDMAMLRTPLMEQRGRQIREVWDNVERDLFELMALESRLFHPRLKILDDDLRVRFSDAPLVGDPVQMEALQAAKVKAGKLSHLEAIMQDRPYIQTREEAEEVEQQIIDENARWLEHQRATQAPSLDAGAAGNTPEQNGAMGGRPAAERAALAEDA